MSSADANERRLTTDSTSKPTGTLGGRYCRSLASDTFNENKGLSRPYCRHVGFGVTLFETMKEDEYEAPDQHLLSFYLSMAP